MDIYIEMWKRSFVQYKKNPISLWLRMKKQNKNNILSDTKMSTCTCLKVSKVIKINYRDNF